jgi:hypothetical protein
VPINKVAEHVDLGGLHIGREFDTRDDLEQGAARSLYRRIDTANRIVVGNRDHVKTALDRKLDELRWREFPIRRVGVSV